jgi:glycosyltransferase involved in cell wall biosynthesis
MGAVCAGALVCAASGYSVTVLHVIPAVAPRYGGPSRAVVEMCGALGARGVETLIAATDADGAARLEVKTGERVSHERVPAIFFPRQWSEAFKYSRPLARWLRAHVAEFDVVHIHAVFSHACLAAAGACRKQGVPYVVRPLGTLDPWSLKQKYLRKRLFWQFGVRRMLKGAAAIHYTTLAEQESAEAALHMTRGVVIPLGIETDLLNESEGARETGVPALSSIKAPYVLVMSRLHQKKGLEVLLPAFLSLVKKPEFAKWQLVLAGEGESNYVASLKSLVKTGGGNGNVVFAGWLDGAQRRNTLRDASLLALTSYQENFGLCAVEALACGVPVLLSPHVNLAQEIETAGAGWIAPMESAALEQTLANTLRDERGLIDRGARGKQLVRQRFTWSAVAVALVNLYNSIAVCDP